MAVSTRVVAIDPNWPDPATLSDAAEVLRRGGLVAFPTETVYGLGADATQEEAVARIFEAKGRPAVNPLIVHAASIEMARSCVAEWSPLAEQLARRFWPGPLTLVMARSALIPDIVTAGQPTVGVRVPKSLVARSIVRMSTRPVAAPSANRSTHISPTLAEHVLKDLSGRVDLVLDAGQTQIGLESTVVDLTTRQPRILRPGPILASEIESVLGAMHVREASRFEASEDQPLRSPGQMAVHYAPIARTLRVDDPSTLARLAWPAGAALVLVGRDSDFTLPTSARPDLVFELPKASDAMHNFYRVLHECDAAGAPVIVILPPPESPEWHALRDRLWRASIPVEDADLAEPDSGLQA